MNQQHMELKSEQRRATRHLNRWWLMPLLMVVVGVGCNQEAKVPGGAKEAKAAADINPAGTYTLVSVDGKKVPCDMQHEGQSLTIKGGSFVINADGTCSSKVDFSVPSHGDASRDVKASYTREGSKLTMQWEGAGTTTGTVEGDTFSMNNEGMVLLYRK